MKTDMVAYGKLHKHSYDHNTKHFINNYFKSIICGHSKH